MRPENSNSLRVVEKLGLHEVGLAPRYLHIDGDWRDHRVFALHAEQAPQSMADLLAGTAQEAPFYPLVPLTVWLPFPVFLTLQTVILVAAPARAFAQLNQDEIDAGLHA